LLLAAVGGCAHQDVGANQVAQDAAVTDDALAVTVEPAALRTIGETVETLGRCEAVPDHIASLTPAVRGQVRESLVQLGGHGAKGRLVAKLDPKMAEATLADKQATRDGAVASLKLLQAPPRPAELKSLELAVDQAKLGVEKATANVERLQPL